MPLRVNVGLTRKVGEANYGSRGASVNVEMELDAALVNEPAKLQQRIRQLFTVVRSSLAEELNGNGKAMTSPANGKERQPPAGTATTTSPATPSSERRSATPQQAKAIYAIARSRNVNLAQFLGERFKVPRPDELTVAEASRAIDELKRMEAPADGAGA